MAVRASKSFYNAANGAAVGADIFPTIKKAKGRSDAKITMNTVKRWATEGLVKLKTERGRNGGQKIVGVKLTQKGRALIKQALAWQSK